MNIRKLAIARAVAVIGSTGALIVGATFAASVGSVSLTGNSFAASQGLQISNGGAFGDTATGFSFGNTAIGGTGSAKQNFFLEDITGGTSALTLSVVAGNCGSFAGLDKSKVHVNIEKDGGTVVDTPTLDTLCAGTPANLDPTNAPAVGGASTKFDVWMTLDSGAITGSLNPLSNTFDLDFTGDDGI